METSSPQTETENPNAEAEAAAEETRPGDVKAKTPMEHWLKRQFPGRALKGLLESLKQLESGVSVPYLAFFGGELTGGLKSDDLYRLIDARAEWEEISRKQQHLRQEIESQGKLDSEISHQIERSADLDRLEDLYAPFKLKRQTLGVQAREAGLGPLADAIWAAAHGQENPSVPGATIEEKAAPFAKADTKFADAASVIKGVQDIFVERIAEAFELRSLVRSTVLRRSKLKATKGPKAKPKSKYTKFFDYQEPIGSLKKPNASHRYLAMRRGWMEDELVLSFERPDEGILLERFEEFACPNKEAPGAEILVQAARLALKGNVYTVMENEAHRHLKEEAEAHVVQTLAENMRKKLLRPGIGRKAVVGIDPGSANQPCSLALVDQNGKLLLNLTFKLEELTDSNKQEFLQSLENLKIEAVAVAHGPRSKEVRDGFRKILEEAGRPLPIISVHEHTASIYASSPAGKEEFPTFEVNARRAVFVARYLQDPLSMILRLDPKFLSLGEFQHDINQGRLRQVLGRVIEASVNFVGVDPNYAPAHVLSRVAGLNIDLARAVVQNREESGPFKTREELKRVPGLAAVFEQAAGFLRVMDSAERLDHTFVHPTSYEAVRAYATAQGAADPFAMSDEAKEGLAANESVVAQLGAANAKNAAFELGHPGEDPRGSFASFEYDVNLKSLADLKKDVPYQGVVTNVTSFGAFVDLGIEQDGLVHISELTDSLAKNPFDSLFTGDTVTVWVSGVNEEKKQISLTMKNPAARAPRERRPRAGGPGGERGQGGNRRPRGPRPPRHGEGPAPEGAVAAEGGGAPHPRGDRPERGDRRPRFRGREGEAGPGGSGGPGGRGPREGRGDRGDRKPRDDKKARKPTRDPKTGAIVKLDQDDGGKIRGLQARAKPHTFNPFANLADILKDKQGKPKDE